MDPFHNFDPPHPSPTTPRFTTLGAPSPITQAVAADWWRQRQPASIIMNHRSSWLLVSTAMPALHYKCCNYSNTIIYGFPCNQISYVAYASLLYISRFYHCSGNNNNKISEIFRLPLIAVLGNCPDCPLVNRGLGLRYKCHMFIAIGVVRS